MEGPVYRSESMFAQEEPEDFSWRRAVRIEKIKDLDTSNVCKRNRYDVFVTMHNK